MSPACIPGHSHRITTQTDPSLPGAGLDTDPAGFHLPGDEQSLEPEFGNILCRDADASAVEFLGKLSAARLSDAFARHRRELPCIFRRASDRRFCSVVDDSIGDGDARDDICDATRLCSRRSRVSGLRIGFYLELLAS
jgi:hypothetical protein